MNPMGHSHRVASLQGKGEIGIMKVLLEIDKKNYDPSWPCVVREAVRAIVLRGDKLALVKSGTEGWYKFPGGGVEKGESQEAAVLRETREETGLVLLPESVRPFGIVRELRRARSGKEEWFEHRSYCYWADAQDQVVAQSLEGDEAELQFELAWVGIQEAYETNKRILEQRGGAPFLLRETRVLELLLDEERTDGSAAESL